MRNRALALAARTIPYIKELREITGSVTASILMQQLDHWFNTYPEGFYKFLAPCENAAYKSGASWTEELGFSEEEFRTAFDKIGIRYQSKKAFDSAEHVFKADDGQEMYYASYHDKFKGLTFYYRNDDLLDSKIDELFTHKAKPRKQTTPVYVTEQPQATETDITSLRKPTTPSYVNREPQSRELGNPNPEYKETKSTTESTEEITSTPSAQPEKLALEKSAKPANLFYESFRLAYESAYSCPYQNKTADFVQLAKCQKARGEWLTMDNWQAAVANYFASELGNHTLADLSVRFGAFFRSALDRYGKPLTNTSTLSQFSAKTQSNVAAAQSYLAKRSLTLGDAK